MEYNTSGIDIADMMLWKYQTWYFGAAGSRRILEKYRAQEDNNVRPIVPEDSYANGEVDIGSTDNNGERQTLGLTATK